MENHLLWIISAVCSATLVGIFIRMKGGFGPNNLKAVGLVLIVFLACILSVSRSDGYNAVVGLLGAVAGYLFGIKTKSSDETKAASLSSVSGSAFGDHAKIAGRDINESINNLHGQIENLESILRGATNVIQTSGVGGLGESNKEYLVDTIFARGSTDQKTAFQRALERWEPEGWKLMSFSSDYQGIDGILVLFSREDTGSNQRIRWYVRSAEEM